MLDHEINFFFFLLCGWCEWTRRSEPETPRGVLKHLIKNNELLLSDRKWAGRGGIQYVSHILYDVTWWCSAQTHDLGKKGSSLTYIHIINLKGIKNSNPNLSFAHWIKCICVSLLSSRMKETLEHIFSPSIRVKQIQGRTTTMTELHLVVYNFCKQQNCVISLPRPLFRGVLGQWRHDEMKGNT